MANVFGAALSRVFGSRKKDKNEDKEKKATEAAATTKKDTAQKQDTGVQQVVQTKTQQESKPAASSNYREEKPQQTNNFMTGLFGVIGTGLAAQDQGGLAQPELARANRDYGMHMQTAQETARSMRETMERDKQEDLLGEHQEASNIFKGAGKNAVSGFANAYGTIGENTYEAEMQKEANSLEQMNLDRRFGDDTRKAAEEALQDKSIDEHWQKIYDYADRVGKSAAEDIEKAKEGLGSVGQAGVDIAQNIIQMGFDAAVGAATGGSSLVPMFFRTFGGAAQEARQEGATSTQQLLYGATKGGIEVATEKIADGVAGIYGKGAADDITEELIRKLSKSDTGRTMLRVLTGALNEGGEEVLSDLLSPVAELIYKDPSLIKLNPSEMLYDFLIGAAVGGLGGSASIATGQNAQANAELRAKDAQAQFNAAEAAQSPVQAQENTETQPAAPVAEAPAESQLPTDLLEQRINDVRARMAEVEERATAAEINDQLGYEGGDNTRVLENYLAKLGAQFDKLQANERSAEPTELTPLAQTILGSQESGWYGDATEQAQQAEAAPAQAPTTVPTTDLGKQSQTAETVRTSPVTNEETAAAIAEAEEAGGFNYLPIENNATMESAGQALQRNGFAHTLSTWEKSITSGRTNASMVATGYLLFNEAQKQGNTEMAIQILSDLQALNTTTAQALQINRMFQSLNPATRYQMVQRQIDKLAQKYSKQLPNGIQVSQELVAQYINAADENARNEALANIKQEVAEQLPSTLKDKLTALRYLNMLGNFKTQGRNLIGNTAMSLTTSAKNAVQFGLERIANLLSGGKTQLTTSLVANPEMVKLGKADYQQHADFINGEGKYSDSAEKGFARDAEGEKRIFKSKFLETYRLLTKAAMEKGDTVFIGKRYARTFAGYLQANGMDAQTLSGIQNGTIEATPEQAKLIEDARNYAAKEAQEATFHDSNTLSDWVSRLGRKETTPKAVKVLAEGVMPFRKTPANVLVRAEEYSPLGLVNTAVKAAQSMKEGSDVTSADVINQLSKSLTGTGLFLLGMALRNNGMLSGHEDDEEQAAFNSLRGQQEYALNLPDGTSFTLDWVAPASMPLFMGAQMMDIVADGDLSLDSLSDVFTSLADPMIEMSMLQGVNDMLDNIKYADNNLGTIAANAALSYLTQYTTNSLLGQAERSFEDKRYSTFVNSGSKTGKMIQRAFGKASAKTPGWDVNQVEYVDAWGRTQSTGNALTRTLTNFLSPGYTSKDQSTKVDDELQRLYDNGMNNVFPDKIAQSYQYTIYNSKGEATGKANLTADEYVQFQKTMGQTSLEMVSDLMKTPLYRTMSDDARAKAISEIYSYARETAAKEVEPNTPSDKTKASTLSNPAAYLGAKAAISTATKAEDYSRLDRLMMRYSELPEDVQNELAKDSTVKYLSQAYDAGVSSKTYMDTTERVKNLTPAEGYTNVSTWQKIGDIANDDNLSNTEKDFFATMYFTNDKTDGKYEEARKANYTPQQIAVFYETYTKNNRAKGKTIDALVKRGFTKAQAQNLYNIWAGGK